MSKSAKIKSPKAVVQSKQAITNANKSQKPPMTKWLGNVFGPKSIGLAILGAILLNFCISENQGYNWAWNVLMKENWKSVRKYPNATIDERNQMKLGFNYVFLNHIVQNTPEDAIILFPYKDQIQDKGGEYQLSHDIAVKPYVTHFIYPRKAVYKDEAATNPYYKKVTHVAIIAGHGYEDLDYDVYQRTYFTIMPKKANDTTLKH